MYVNSLRHYVTVPAVRQGDAAPAVRMKIDERRC